MRTTTISEVSKIAKADWHNYQSSVHHPDDEMPFNEWLSENKAEYLLKYGIYYHYDRYMYAENNVNFTGNDICPVCDAQCKLTDDEICDACINEML